MIPEVIAGNIQVNGFDIIIISVRNNSLDSL